ncbi:hypothetical protein FACS18949_02260 [Clostridia bacterium]|nr:hypothetical protein FACS18949_02260 [Clostridia bacterium]
MTIAVASPVHGQAGNTTNAILIALLLAETQNKKVCLTHLSANNTDIFEYLGADRLSDKTCTPSQVAKLLKVGTLTPRDIPTYCLPISENLDIFSNTGDNTKSEDLEAVQDFLLKENPYDFLVVDVDVNLSSAIAKNALEKSGVVVVSLKQSHNVLVRHKSRETDAFVLKSLFIYSYYNYPRFDARRRREKRYVERQWRDSSRPAFSLGVD